MPKQPPIRELGDLPALAALAHPRRRQILDQLKLRGPATSAMLARALDLNTGATSYHLRELAAHGFVAETGHGGHPRQRWWHAVTADLRFPPRSRQSDDVRAVVDEMNRSAFAADLRALEEAQQENTGPWADGCPYSRGSIQVTLPELAEFFEAFIALVNRYKRDPEELPEGARTVHTRFLAFPAPESPTPADPAPADPDPNGPDRDSTDRNGPDTRGTGQNGPDENENEDADA